MGDDGEMTTQEATAAAPGRGAAARSGGGSDGRGYYDFDAVKRNHDLISVMARYHVPVRGPGLIRCPLPGHDDRKASFSVFAGDDGLGYWRCHGGSCQRRGDVIAFVCEMEGFTGPGRIREAMRVLGEDGPRTTHAGPVRPAAAFVPRRADRTPGETEAVRFAARYYGELPDGEPVLSAGFADAARTYVEGRGVPARVALHLGVGFGRRGMARAARAQGIELNDLIEGGVVRARYGREGWEKRLDGRQPVWADAGDDLDRIVDSHDGRLILPDAGLDGSVDWFVGRAIDRTVEPAYLNVRGRKPFLGLRRLVELRERDGAARYAAIVLVEGPFDYVAARMAGLPAAAVQGGAARALVPQLERFERVLLMFDADDGGYGYVQEFRKLLGDRTAALWLPAGEDPGDHAERGATGELAAMVGDAERALAAGESRPDPDGYEAYVRADEERRRARERAQAEPRA